MTVEPLNELPNTYTGTCESGQVAVPQHERFRLGSALAAIGREFGGVELDIYRDPTPPEVIDFG